eukprot:SAG22_NODE_202_length_15324_cov_7.802627_3_plen_160_part_00
MVLKRYTVPWADFATTPISPVIVDTATGTITLAGLVFDDIITCPARPLPAASAELKGDLEAETRFVLAAIRDILAALGGTPMLNMVSCLAHVLDINGFSKLNAAFMEHFKPGSGPARTTVQAGAIIFGASVELSVTALCRDVDSLPAEGALQPPAEPTL